MPGELADERWLADAQHAAVDFALQALAGLAADVVGEQWRASEGAGNRMFRAAFQGGGEAQAGIAVPIA
ncbi:hypothetical protein D3C78_1683350 [compost metagenome]